MIKVYATLTLYNRYEINPFGNNAIVPTLRFTSQRISSSVQLRKRKSIDHNACNYDNKRKSFFFKRHTNKKMKPHEHALNTF